MQAHVKREHVVRNGSMIGQRYVQIISENKSKNDRDRLIFHRVIAKKNIPATQSQNVLGHYKTELICKEYVTTA